MKAGRQYILFPIPSEIKERKIEFTDWWKINRKFERRRMEGDCDADEGRWMKEAGVEGAKFWLQVRIR